VSIPKLRVDRALEKAREALLRQGIPISFDEVKKQLKDVTAPDRPQMQLVQQKRKQPLNIPAHNKMLWQADEDFYVLFEEFYLQATQSLRYLDRNDALLRRTIQDARRTGDIIHHDLLRLSDANGYFLGSFDTFKDLNLVSQSSTTAAIDLGTESVRLPRSQGVSNRLDLSHLRTVFQAPLTILGDTKTHLVRSKTLPGMGFGNCFDSLQTSWQQEIVSTLPDDLACEITFDLTPDKSPARITSLVIDPLLSNASLSGAMYSPDGLNWIPFPQLREREFDGIKVRIYGPQESVVSIRLQFLIDRPARQEADGSSTYYLSLKEIEVYKEGFVESAVLVSNTHVPNAENGFTTIDKVSLKVDEELPENTDIEYEVAPSTDPTAFRKISPINRRRVDIPDVIDFDQMVEVFSQNNPNEIITTSLYTFPDSSTTRRGIEFHEVYTFPVSPRFMTTKVRRGIGGWRLVQREGPKKLQTERGNTISFDIYGLEDIPLYIDVSGEEVSIHPVSTGTSQTEVATRFPIISQEKPSKALLRPSRGLRNTSLTFTASGNGVGIRVGTAAEGLEGDKILYFPVGVLTYSQRVKQQSVRLDYIDKQGNGIAGSFDIKQVVGGEGTDILLLLEDDKDVLQESSQTLEAVFESLDVVGDVSDQGSSSVFFDKDLEILAGDVFIFDYKRPLQKNETLLPETVDIRSGGDNSTQYKIDTDYTINAVENTVDVVIGGAIHNGTSSTTSTIVIQFSYESRNLNLHTYETYVTVPKGKSTEIETSALSIADEEDATILLGTGEKPLNIAQTLELAPGVYRVSVITKPTRLISAGIDTTTALYKTINLTDKDGNYVFGQGRYFERQEAFLGTMTETSFFRLHSSVRRDDHSFFAVKDSKLIFNFDPLGNETDVFTLVPGSVSPLRKERIEVGYQYLPNTSDPIPGVIFRATLRRLPGTTPDLTPSLYSYDLRFAHG